MTVQENGRDYRVVIANMGTINPGKRLVVDPTYHGLAEDFAKTFRRQKAMEIDIWVAAHGSQYGLHSKYRPGHLRGPGRIPFRGRAARRAVSQADRRRATVNHGSVPELLSWSRAHSLRSPLETQPRLNCCFLSFIGAKRGDCYADTGDKTSDISVPQARQLLASINAQAPRGARRKLRPRSARLYRIPRRCTASSTTKAMTQAKEQFVMRTCRLQCE